MCSKYLLQLDGIPTMCTRGLRESDAGFVTSAYVFEAESMEAIKSWFSEWNQDIYIIGPLLPTGYGIDEESDRGSKETSDFLQKSLVEYGENSVMLVRTCYRHA